MAQSPYFDLIQRYFPFDQWEIADCISVHECSPNRAGYPETCVAEEGQIRCRPDLPYVQAKSWGIFGILDACWNPEMNPDSPFTKEQWAKVLDPNVNTWMASVIWERSGWDAWTTCGLCDACDVPGGPIPHPRAPVVPQPQPAISTKAIIGGGIALALGALLIWSDRKGR